MSKKPIPNKSLIEALYDNNQCPVFIHTFSEKTFIAKVYDCNLAFTKLMGESKERFISYPFSFLSREPDSSQIAELIHGNSIQYDTFMKDRNSKYFHVRLYCCPVGKSCDRFLITIVIMIPPAKKQSIETYFEKNTRDLQLTENECRELVENISDGISIINRDGYFVYVNNVIIDRSGFSKEQMMKVHFFDIIDEKDRALAETYFHQVMNGEDVPPFEICYRGANNEINYVELNQKPLVKNNEIIGVICITHNISDKKRTEEQLVEVKTKFQTVSEQALVGIGIVQDNKMVYANEALCNLVGFSHTEMMTMSMDKIIKQIHPKYRNYVVDQLRKKLLGEKDVVERYSYRIYTKNGTERWIDQFSKTINLDGRNADLFMWVDITEQKRAEKTLRESEYQYRELFESSPIGICRTLLDGTILNLNTAMARLLGYTNTEALVTSLSGNLFNTLSNDDEYLTIEGAVTDSNAFESEEKFRRKDGDIVIFKVHGRLIKNPTYEKPFFEGFYEDITNQKIAEKALKRSEEQYRNLIENSKDIIFSVDNNGRFTYVSPQVEILGFTQDEMLETDILDLIITEDKERVMKDFALTFDSGCDLPTQFRMFDRHGKIRWFEDYGRVLRDDLGNIVGLTGILRDISDRKKAEIALTESEMTNRALLDAIPDLMFRMSNDGTFLNYKAPRDELLALTPDLFLGKNVKDVLSEQITDLINNNIEKAIETQEIRIFEYQLDVPLRSGNYRYFEARMVAISNEEVLVIIRDISERKKAEKQIIQSLREKEILLKEIHHRVKNNLQIISSLLHLQSRRLDDPVLLEKFTECQARIQSIALIHTKLYQSKDFQRLDFGDYVKGLTSYLFRMFGSKIERVNLYIDVQGYFLDLDTAIPLGLIINELVSNAVKHAFFGRESGEIRIAMDRVNESTACLLFSDDGIGLPDNFDLNTGQTLGLILINSLIDQIDGKLEVDCDKGTTFKITFEHR